MTHFVKTRLSMALVFVMCATLLLAVPAPLALALEPSAKIALDSSMVTNETSYGTVAYLVDEQTKAADPRGGSCSKFNEACAPANQWGPGHAASAYINLGQPYTLTDFYLYDTNGTGDVILSVGSPGGGWTDIATVSMNTYRSWKSYKPAVPVISQYVRMTMVGSGANFSEIVLYGSPPDVTPPAQVTDLTAVSASTTSAKLTWTAPGEDGHLRTASTYDIRYSTSNIASETAWSGATPVSGLQPPAAPGTGQSVTIGGLQPNTTYYFAIKTADAAGNWSPYSNVVSRTTNPAGIIPLTTNMVTKESTLADNPGDLVDEQGTFPSGVPSNQWTAGGAAGNYPLSAYINLGRTYHITDVRIFDSNGSGTFILSSGTPGSWTVRQTISTNVYWQWRQITPTTPYETQYVRATLNDNASFVRQLILFGYRDDEDAPATINDLAYTSLGTTSVGLTWTAPGDDDFTGNAVSYDIRMSSAPITEANWLSASPVSGIPAPGAPGVAQSMTVNSLAPGTIYYFAMKTTDDAGNVSALSNSLKTGTSAYACTKTITFDANAVVKGDSSAGGINAQPDDVVCIDGGTHTQLQLTGFNGSPGHEITIVNKNVPLVISNNNLQYAISVQKSTYFRLTGSGNPLFEYGIQLINDGTVGSALKVGELSTNYEVDHVEVVKAGFSGFNLKTDPKCDLSANRGVFVQRDTRIHDNYIHDTRTGEGIYFGYTFYNGHDIDCGGVTTTVYGHEIEGVRIYNNVIDHTAWDGMQLGSATKDVEVYNNRITNYAYLNEQFQNSGLQIGLGTTGRYYNNYISNGAGGSGNAIRVNGRGDIRIYNNLVVDAGAYGIYSDDRVDPSNPIYDGQGNHFDNNTFINPALGGIMAYNEQTTGNTVKNNLLVIPSATDSKTYINSIPGSDWAISNNLTTTDIHYPGFVNAAGGNYRLTSGSPAVDAGADLTSSGITFDKDNATRPYNGTFDIGAFEYRP